MTLCESIASAMSCKGWLGHFPHLLSLFPWGPVGYCDNCKSNTNPVHQTFSEQATCHNGAAGLPEWFDHAGASMLDTIL